MNKSTLKQSYFTAIDIGTSKIACLIAEIDENNQIIIKDYKLHKSTGIKNGQIVDIELVKQNVAKILDEIEATIGGKQSNSIIINAAVNQLSSVTLVSDINVAGHPISDSDINNLISHCVANYNLENKKIIHCIPTGYKIDNMDIVKEPRGMYGSLLSLLLHVVSADKWHLKNIETVLESLHISNSVMVVSPYASALACLNDYEKELGSVLIDLGAGTTSICVFYNNQLYFNYVLPVGGEDITKNIAQKFTISFAQAEKTKIYDGSAFLLFAYQQDFIYIDAIDPKNESETSIKKSELTSVIAATLEEIFEMVNSVLREYGLHNLPSNRVVLTGGGACLQGVKELASAVLGFNVSIKNPINISNMPKEFSVGNFTVCCGLLQFAVDNPSLFLKKRDYSWKKSKIFKWFLQNF